MSMIRVVDLTPVLSTSIYADNDTLFIPIEIPGVFKNNGPAELVSATVFDSDDQGTEFDLVFTSADLVFGALNGPVDVTDADALKYLGVVSFVAADVTDLINSQIFVKRNIGLIMAPGANSSLWVSGVVRSGTPTYTASGMKIKLAFKVD